MSEIGLYYEKSDFGRTGGHAMERREALAAYNDAYKEQDDLYRAVARQC